MSDSIRTHKSRSPESAPHCPECGYSFYGIERLRCSECGFEVRSDADLKRARWLSDDNADNRRVAARHRYLIYAGAALMFLRAVGIVSADWNRQTYIQLYGVKITLLGLWSLGTCLWRRWVGEPLHRHVFTLGLLWVLVAWLSWII